MNPLYAFFPKTAEISEMRTNQKEALDLLWSRLEVGCTKITLCAPVGAGKSAIFATLANYFSHIRKKSLYVSPLNQLVNQMDSSGFGVTTLKGRKNYPCISKADGSSCDDGFCQYGICPHSKRQRDCNHNEYIACNTCLCINCIYKQVFQSFKASTIGNSNFSLMLAGVTNSPDVLIIDECDSIENFIRLYNRVVIPEIISYESFRDHIDFLNVYSQGIQEAISNLFYLQKEATISETQTKELKKKKQLLEKIDFLLSDYETYKEPWVCLIDKEHKKTKYEPITVNRFLTPLLEKKIVILMSATPQKMDNYTWIEVQSTFPISTRQWMYKPMGKMSYVHRGHTIPKLADWLATLQGKTVVHCVSYLTAEKISDALRKIGIYPYLQIPDSKDQLDNTVDRHNAIEAFVKCKDQNKILLSVKLDRGVDFWQPDILNNVIAVLPYPNPIDPLTIAKNKYLGTHWQNVEIAQTVSQMMGRIFRNEKLGIYNGIPTPKRGYIVASEWGGWYRKNKSLFPAWFRECNANVRNL